MESLLLSTISITVFVQHLFLFSFMCMTPVQLGNYHWDFGDSSVSIETNPLHTYTKQGSYEVHLITYSKEGCIDSPVKSLQTGQVNVDFTAPNSFAAIVLSWFRSTSSSLPKYAKWTINGTVVSTSVTGFRYSFANPGIIPFNSPGFWRMCFYERKKHYGVTKAEGCFYTFGRFAELCVSFTCTVSNTSQNADAYTWNFGDGTSSSRLNSSHTYSMAGNFHPF